MRTTEQWSNALGVQMSWSCHAESGYELCAIRQLGRRVILESMGYTLLAEPAPLPNGGGCTAVEIELAVDIDLAYGFRTAAGRIC